MVAEGIGGQALGAVARRRWATMLVLLYVCSGRRQLYCGNLNIYINLHLVTDIVNLIVTGFTDVWCSNSIHEL